MGFIAKGIPRDCQGLFTPVSLGYPLSVFNKNSTLKGRQNPASSSRPEAAARAMERAPPHPPPPRPLTRLSVYVPPSCSHRCSPSSVLRPRTRRNNHSQNTFFSIPFRFNFGFNKRQGRKRKKGKKRGKKKEKKSESTVSSACREEAVGTRDGEREKGRGRGE